MVLAAARIQSEVVKLQSERQEILKKLDHLQVEMYNLAEPTADEADVNTHEREKIWALMQSLKAKLESIDRALNLARNGRYGTCQTCGDEIDPARLEILPQATLCLKCQRDWERHNRRP